METGVEILWRLAAKFLMMPFYYRIERLVMEMAERYDREGKKLIDIGAENSPYRRYFSRLEYVSCDRQQNREGTVQIVGDVEAGLAGVAAAGFDLVLCTQVIEHLQRPERAFREFNRILKPGGRLFLTTNFMYQIHMAPSDYFRFTEYGLRFLGTSSGFEVERIRAHGGGFQVLSYVAITLPLRLILDRWRATYWGYLILLAPVIIVVNRLAVILDSLDKRKLMTVNYEAIYKKVR